MIKAVIIDFDDTLVQTARFRQELFKEVVQSWTGLSDEEVALDFGRSFHSLRHMIDAFIDANNYDAFIQYYKNIMGEKPTEPCMGAERFLQRLHQRQIPIVILSSSIHELIEFDLDVLGFLKMIDHVFDAEMVQSPKSDSRALHPPIEWLQKNYNINPSECVYVGDALSDMECSHGQMDFFAVTTGKVSRQEFISHGVPENKIADNLDDLYNILFG